MIGWIMQPLIRPRRLVSVDIMKGIGIIAMLFSHALFKGVWYTEGTAANVVGEHAPWVIPLALPLVITATWPGFFVLISGMLNAYLTARRLEKGRSMRTAVAPLYVSAVLFLLIHVFMVTVLHDIRPDLHYPEKTTAGLFGNLMVGNGPVISSGQWYQHTILSLLAFANVFFALVMTVLFRDGAWKNRRKTSGRLLILAAIVLIISALVSEPSYALILRLVPLQRIWSNIVIFILQCLSASQLDLFPLGAYGLFGMVTALYLLEDPDRRNYGALHRFLRNAGILATLLGIILIVIRVLTADAGPVDAIFVYEPYPIHLAVFNLGLILFVLDLAMKVFEYRTVEGLKRLSDRTRYLRAAGMLTLTLYMLEFQVRGFLGFQAHRLFGGDPDFPEVFLTFGFDEFMIRFWPIMAYLAVIMAFWLLLIWLLIRLRFRGSAEWFFTRIANLLRKEDKSQKSDMDAILYPFGTDKE